LTGMVIDKVKVSTDTEKFRKLQRQRVR